MDLDLNLSDTGEVVEDDSRRREDSFGPGSVLVTIATLAEEMKDRFNRMEKQVMEIGQAQKRAEHLTAEKNEEVSAGLKSLKSIVENFAGSITDVKTKRSSALNLQHLMYAAGPERAVLPLLTWAIIITVMSYVRAMPSLRFWVSEAMWSKMVPYEEILDHSQGFAMILFAAKNNSKVKLATGPGRIWTFLVRRALRSGLIHAKTNLFRKDEAAEPAVPVVRRSESMGIPTSSVSVIDPVQAPNPPCEPDWLMRFKTNSDIIRAVDEAMQKFEGNSLENNASSAPTESLSEGPSSRPRKRKKGNGSLLDPDHEFRKHVVKQIRTIWLEKMNHGRTAVRAYLYKKLVFVLDKISQFKDVEIAAQNGYKIVLGREASVAETIGANTANLKDGIWNVPDAHVSGVDDADKKNKGLMEDLQRAFPSLNATIVYKKQVMADRTEADPTANVTPSNPAEFISLTEKVSLHEVGNEMLMEIVSCEDSASVLRVSQLSLKAVHVLALALRGLVIRVLHQYRPTTDPLSEMEAAALGADVNLDDDKKVSVMMEKYLKNGRGKVTDTYASCYREKFTISEEDAEELRKSMRVAEAEIAAGTGGNRESDTRGEIEDDGVEDWIKMK